MFLIMALIPEAPIVEYTGTAFCYLTQAIATVGVMAKYAISPGNFVSGFVHLLVRYNLTSDSTQKLVRFYLTCRKTDPYSTVT